MMPRTLLSVAAVVVAVNGASAQVMDLSAWTLVEDPASPFFDAAINGPGSASLFASDATGTAPGFVPNGTDIGFQSIDGASVAESTSGFAFDRSSSFSLAIDYSASFVGASGGLSFGFGIGEDSLGANSAGVVFVTEGGLPAAIPFAGPAGGGATVNDSAVAGLFGSPLSSSPANLMGSFHVSYDALSGDITVGVGATGALAPTPGATATFAGADVANQWNGDDLLASFFIRSDTVTVPIFGTVSSPWSDGSAEVEFSSLRVVEGAAYEVPTPASAIVLAGMGLVARRRR